MLRDKKDKYPILYTPVYVLCLKVLNTECDNDIRIRKHNSKLSFCILMFLIWEPVHSGERTEKAIKTEGK